MKELAGVLNSISGVESFSQKVGVMGAPASSARNYRVGLFEINLESGEVHKSGRKIALQEQPFRVLAMLLEHPGEIVSREQLQARLWPADTFVSFDEGLNTAIRKLRVSFGDSADNPRFIETIPRRGYRFVAPVQGGVADTSRRTESAPADSTAQGLRRRPGTIPRLDVVLAAAVLVLVVSGVIYLSRSHPPTSVAAVSVPRVKMRKSVAVLRFQNASKRDETSWLSTALSQMLSTELSAGERLRIIPAENVARMERDLSLAETDTLASDTLKRVRNYVGGDLILVGSYATLGKVSGGQLRLDVRLQDATTGETIAAVAESGSEINLFDLVSRAGSDLRRRLGLGEVAPVDAAGVQASYPNTPEAARFYTLGLAQLRVFDSRQALVSFQKAAAVDPKFPLTHSALAAAWSALGYDDKAKEEGKLAFELSGSLSREDRLLVEGQYREKAREWPVAIEVYRTLAGFFPDNLEYGLRLANAQSRGGKAKDALGVIATLRMLPAPQGDDPRISLQEAGVKRALGDSKGQLEAAAAAANQAAAQGSKFVEANARLSEGSAQFILGEKDKALTAWEESRRIWASAGYRGEVAKTQINTGLIFYQMGDLPAAEKRYQEALSIWRTTGNKAGEGTALANLANLRNDEGDLAGAKQMFLDVLAISRELGGTDALTLVDLGDVRIGLGDVGGAIPNFREAVELARQQSDRWTLAAALCHISRAYYLGGDLKNANPSIREALDITRQTGDKPHAARTLANWGEILLAEGDLGQARKNFTEALKIRTEISETSNATETRLQLAALSIEEGNAADAERAAREVRDEYRKEGHPDNEIEADAVLLRALYAENKADEAVKEAGHAKTLLAKSQNVPNRLALRIVDAQIQAASGQRSEALQDLVIATRDAAKCGFVLDQLEARLAHAEIELMSGKTLAGHGELAAVKKDAGAKGFGLIAQKATALMAEKRNRP